MKKSFTLVELIIVLAVTSTLAAFTSGQYGGVVRDSKLAKTKNDLKIVRDATVQYIIKTEHIPVNTSGIGVAQRDFKIAEKEYLILNLDLLSKEQLLDNGEKVPASIPYVPTSSVYLKSGAKNAKKQEPSFIYVIDKNLNVYLASGSKDTATGYFIYTKIYETADADVYDKQMKMNYEGNRPIIEQTYEKEEDDTITDSTIIKNNVQIIPDIAIDIPKGETIPGNKNVNQLYYKDLSIAGFNVYLDAYDIDLGKIDSVNMDIKAGGNSATKTMYAVKSSRWLGMVNVKDFQYYSGNYECKIYAITKNKEKVDIGNFVILVDRVKPTISIDKSKNDFYSSSPININIVASDAETSSGIKKIRYKINNEEWLDYKETIVLAEPDYYEIQAMAIDNFGNESKITSTIINNYSNPEIYLTKTSTGLSIKLGVDIDDEDILWQNGFETTDKSVSFNSGNTPKYGVSGGQSFDTLQKFEGDRSYKLEKNNDGNGNHYGFPNTSSNNSITWFGSAGNTLSNNIYLSIAYRYKSSGNSTIRHAIDGGWARKITYLSQTVVEDAPAGSNKIKLNTVSSLGIGSYITADIDDMKVSQMFIIIEIDKVNNIITLNRNLNREFKAGEKLASRAWRGVGSFGNNNVTDTEGEWRLYNTVTKTNNYEDYDIGIYSGSFYMTNTASNELNLDNLKMGYASRMILYKNGVRFNTTSQEYTTSYTDNNIPDKNKPKIEDVTIGKSSNNYTISIKARDEGTAYEYYMESISRSGNVKKSKTRSVTSISDISKYYYLINNSPSTSVVPTNESTPDSVMSTVLDDTKTWYIHLVAEDGGGNKSSVYHKQIN